MPKFEHDCEFNRSGWSFEQLADSEVFAAAAREVREADLVVIAAWGAKKSPSAIRRLLDAALSPAAMNGRALVALLGGAGGTSTPAAASEFSMEGFLQKVAVNAGMQYLPYWFAMSDENPEASVSRIGNGSSTFLQLPPAKLPDLTDFRDWGINE